MNKLKLVYVSACSAAVTIAAVVAMTIGAEISAPFKSWLAGLTGHHWVTKSWASIVIFALFFYAFQSANKNISASEARKALVVLELFSILGFLAVLGFYLYEFLTASPAL